MDSNSSIKQEINLEEKNKKKALFKMYLKNMSNEERFKFWIKTLLSSYNNFPEIIRTLDRIIELQASTISFSSDIYNCSNSIENQVEKVIDLSQRKSSLLNIHIMTKELLKSLSDDQSLFIKRRFVFNWSIEDLSVEYNFSIRSIYRKIDKVINNIYNFAINKHWTLRFIESQIENETWLKNKFNHFVFTYFKNSNYKITNLENENNYSKLSSES